MIPTIRHSLQKDFLSICEGILQENKSIEEWAAVESDDMFQKGNYVGGFDATEMAFCFSVFVDHREYWFQVFLEEIKGILSGEITELDVRKADY
jgi:hypothetical protein